MRAVWLMDAQERLMPHIDGAEEVISALRFFLRGARVLKLPVLVTEQRPEKLGPTLAPLRELLPAQAEVYPKTTFSGCGDTKVGDAVAAYDVREWILMGVEAHICILQTARDLKTSGSRVTVLADAVGARRPQDRDLALDELRSLGVRVTSTEALLYELIEDADTPEFKELLPMLREKVHA